MTDEFFWRKLKEIGWLNYLSAEEQDDLRPRLNRDLADNDEWAFLNLNQGGYDPEDVDYQEVLTHMSEVSRKVFNPNRIEVKKINKGGNVQIAFHHSNMTYSCTVSEDNEFGDEAVFKLINQAVADCDVKQRFILLPTDDQTVGFVFVPPAVYDAAIREKLIPTADELAEMYEEMDG